jgi:poly-gamma-glutamate capsule biosynthesis protein CapA/YwtB (metallophosphatase superfamily)
MSDQDPHQPSREELRRQRSEARRRAVRRRRAVAVAVLLVVVLAIGIAVAEAIGGGSGSATSPGSGRPGGPGGTHAATTSSTTTPPTSTARPHGTGTLTIAAVGDTMLGRTGTLPSDAATYLEGVRSQLHGDVVFGNLEGTLTNETVGKCGAQPSADCFEFRVPPIYAHYLHQAGFTMLSQGNNHSFDYGQAGLDSTISALDHAGIHHTGRTHEITYVRSGNLRIAFIGFGPYPNNAPLNDFTAAGALIHQAAQHADIVVTSMHAGAEGVSAEHLSGKDELYLGENRGNPEAFAHMAIDAGSDLVLGSGPHVLRAMQIYHGRLIAYSLGNFAGYHNFGLDGDLAVSAVLQAKLAADGRFLSGHVASVRLVAAGQPELDPTGAGAQLIGRLSEQDLGASGAHISASGAIT